MLCLIIFASTGALVHSLCSTATQCTASSFVEAEHSRHASTMRHDEYETPLTYVSYMLTVILPQTMSAAALLTRQLRSVLGSPVMHLRAVQYAQLRDLLARLPSAGGAGSSW